MDLLLTYFIHVCVGIFAGIVGLVLLIAYSACRTAARADQLARQKFFPEEIMRGGAPRGMKNGILGTAAARTRNR